MSTFKSSTCECGNCFYEKDILKSDSDVIFGNCTNCGAETSYKTRKASTLYIPSVIDFGIFTNCLDNIREIEGRARLTQAFLKELYEYGEANNQVTVVQKYDRTTRNVVSYNKVFFDQYENKYYTVETSKEDLGLDY